MWGAERRPGRTRSAGRMTIGGNCGAHSSMRTGGSKSARALPARNRRLAAPRNHWVLVFALLVTTVAVLTALDRRTPALEIRDDVWKTGDVLFITGASLRSRVVRALQLRSVDYSHVGIVDLEAGRPFVIHADPAVGKVVRQSWDGLRASGEVLGGAIYRVREARDRTAPVACAAARRFAERRVPFDERFDLRTDDRLFCTELVLRAYRFAGVDLCADAESHHPQLLPSQLIAAGQLYEVVRF